MMVRNRRPAGDYLGATCQIAAVSIIFSVPDTTTHDVTVHPSRGTSPVMTNWLLSGDIIEKYESNDVTYEFTAGCHGQLC